MWGAGAACPFPAPQRGTGGGGLEHRGRLHEAQHPHPSGTPFRVLSQVWVLGRGCGWVSGAVGDAP